jgi:hypothetical protein
MKISKENFIKAKKYVKFWHLLLLAGFIIVFSILSSDSKATGNTYYISPTGLDTYSGTLAQPFKTITKGLAVAAAGDTVLVKAGTYNEYVQFTKSGTVGSPITLKNYGTDVVTVDAQNSRVYAIYGDDVSNIVIDGINVQNATSSNIRFSGNQNLTIKNLTSTLAVGSSVTAMNVRFVPSTVWSTNLTLQNVNTYGGSYGVYLGEGKINGLNIIGGKYQYAAWDGLNLTLESTGDTSVFNQNILVDGAETSYNQRQGIDVIASNLVTLRNIYSHHNGATGIQLENQVSNALIEDFICENNSQNPLYTYETGVWIDASSNVIVRRGIMRNNQTGFRVAANSTNITANNLLIYSNQDGYSDGNSAGVDFSESSATLYNSVIDSNSLSSSNRGSVAIRGTGNYILKNNIISNDKSNYDIFRTGTNTLTSDYNLIYNTRAINVYNLTKASTWSAYKTSTGQDSHSINIDPLFVDSSNGNFKLKSGSPAINAGVNVGLTTDFLQSPISGLPDIGAYESNSSVVVTTPNTYTISYTPGNGGTITGTLSQTVNSGTNGTAVTAVPSTGYTFVNWSDGISTASRTDSNVTANKSLTANFAVITTIPTTYSLKLNALNGKVNVSPNKTLYNSGDVVTLNASPSLGYIFNSWSGDVISTSSSTTITMNSNKSVTASFISVNSQNPTNNKPTTYNLNTTSVNGVITKSPNKASYALGDIVTLTATPAAGYNFSSWGGDISGLTSPIVLMMDPNDTNVTANFSAINSTTLYLTKTLRYGSRDGEVKILQMILTNKGYLTAKIDGVFGRATLSAVKAFQKANGLKADGVVGATTRADLNS